MKHVLLLLTFITFFASVSHAQDIQLHYDFGEDRKMITTTIENFKADDYGTTFFFVDFEYGSEASGVDGVSLAYMELARTFSFWENPFSAHAEYNGGIFRTTDFAAQIENAYLAGVDYFMHSSDFSKTLNLKALYKHIQDKHDATFQFTAVWGLNFEQQNLTFAGFADFWKEDNSFFADDGTSHQTEYVFIAEPQLWYNFNRSFSAGTEIEVSNNFGGNKGFMVNPTLAIKWTL